MALTAGPRGNLHVRSKLEFPDQSWTMGRACDSDRPIGLSVSHLPEQVLVAAAHSPVGRPVRRLALQNRLGSQGDCCDT
jgi:hypothetical protein